MPSPAPLAAILDAYLSTLARHLPTLSPAHMQALAEPTRLLLVACAATQDVPGSADASGAGSTIERARRIVRDHIAAPDFGPVQLCRELAMSRSKLYRVFERTGGVAAFIQRERLQVAFERLTSSSGGSIGTVAADVGFADHSTFSRAFRRAFGVSPRDIRGVVAPARSVHPHGGR
ncbi:helix-turn-helix domain-containing protein [Alsobacter sp. R-9]